MAIWNKQSKIYKPQHFIKDFNLFKKPGYRINWSVEKEQTVKVQGSQRRIKENQCFYQNVQCVIVNNWDLSKSKKPVVDY